MFNLYDRAMKIKSLIYPALLTGLLLAFLFSCKKETPKVAPTPSVAEVATVTGTTATIKIGIVSDGGATITERGVCWNTSPNPTINNHIRSATLSNGTISLTISDLLPNKTYYFRAYAVNPAGVGYSEQSTITTLTLAPALTTLDLTAVTSTTASGGGNITSDGGVGVTARGICWSLNQNPTIADSRTVDGSGTGSFTSTITGLTPGARYHFRAYATNSEGTNYGNEVTATIPGVLPVLTTKAMAGVYTYSASTGGVISNNGGVPLTACGVAWSTNPSPTINDNISVFKTPVANFIIKISGLNAGTTYYIRAYATNSIGTAYGDQLSFKTNDAVNPAEDYLPLQVGNYWEFSDGHYISSLQIDQIEAFNGTDYYRIIRKENPVPPRQDTIYYRKTADGKFIREQDQPMKWLRSTWQEV